MGGLTPLIYLIGSLRNANVPLVGQRLRGDGYDVFDDWFAAGPEADDYWQKYEKAKGHTFAQALDGEAAKHVFNFDNTFLLKADAVVLMLPAGKSGHLELGVSIGRGKPGFIYLPDGEPERYDVMYRYATKVVTSYDDLVIALREQLQ